MRKRKLWSYILARSILLFTIILTTSFTLYYLRQNLCTLSTTPHHLQSRSTHHQTPPQYPPLQTSELLKDTSSPDDIVTILENWKNPDYVQNRLRIYVYDLPHKYNIGLVHRSHQIPPRMRDPYCNTSFYSAEYHFHQYLLSSPARTLNPEQADFYYVPIYTTCFLTTHLPNNVTRTGEFFSKGMMEHVVNGMPYWKRSMGRDHVFMFTQGFAGRLSGDAEGIWRNSVFLVHNGELTAGEYVAHKDVTVPPELKEYFRPIWMEGRGRDGEVQLKVKKWFVQFGGQVVRADVEDHRGRNYSGGVRQFVQRELVGRKGYRITGVREGSYVDDMMESVFCLAPEGWHPWSPRPYYAVLLGCIPVIISEKQELAFEDLINWDDFAVWVRPGDVKKMDEALRKFKMKDIERRLQAMQKVWRLLWYGEEGLANEAILYQLYRRRYVSKLKRKFIS